MIAKIAYLLNLMSLRRWAMAFFLLSPLFINQGERVSMRLVYGAGYLFAAPVLFLGLFYGATKAFQPFRLKLESVAATGVIFFSLVSILANTPEDIFSPFWYFGVFLKLLVPMSCFFILKNMFDHKDVSILYSMLVSVGVISFSFLIAAFTTQIEGFLITHKFRFSLFFDDANRYSCFIAVIFGLAFPVLVKRYLDGHNFFGMALVCLMLVVGVIASGSRSGMLLCTAIYFTNILATRKRRLLVNSLIILLPVAVVMVIVVSFRYSIGGKAEVSDMLHAMTFRFAWEIIQKHPFVGVGLGNITKVYDEKLDGFYPLKLVVHNSPLGVAADIGVLGMLCWLALLIIPAWGLLRKVVPYSRKFFPHAELAGLNILVVFFLGGMFLPYDLLNDHFWAYLAIPYILLKTDNSADTIRLEYRLSRGDGGMEKALPE